MADTNVSKSGVINGYPTKIFFINMLTRDISLNDAIIDLIDNSIDGANRIRPDGNFQDLYVKITINKNAFIIKDNCGGFSLEIAQKYAFRFGRPEDAPNLGGSVGRFGVGMKRALFKMGKEFEVESKSDHDHFQIDVDIEEWKAKKSKSDEEANDVEDWNFQYNFINDETINLDEKGTFIHVKKLYPDVSSAFDDQEFLNNLKNDIEKTLNFSLESGLAIWLNGVRLKKKDIVLFEGDSIEPYYYKLTKELDSSNQEKVEIKIIAGISFTGSPNDAGWYIYCNNRLVLEKDQSEITGWGVGSINKFHHKFAMFRGIVFFSSENTINLPLTTTKKGIDATSEIYKTAKSYMREALLQIQTYLKNVDKLEDPDNYRKAIGDDAHKISILELSNKTDFKIEKRFTPPTLNIDEFSSQDNLIRISFKADKNLVNKVKESLIVKSNKELGEALFDYYLKMEEII